MRGQAVQPKREMGTSRLDGTRPLGHSPAERSPALAEKAGRDLLPISDPDDGHVLELAPICTRVRKEAHDRDGAERERLPRAVAVAPVACGRRDKPAVQRGGVIRPRAEPLCGLGLGSVTPGSRASRAHRRPKDGLARRLIGACAAREAVARESCQGALALRHIGLHAAAHQQRASLRHLCLEPGRGDVGEEGAQLVRIVHANGERVDALLSRLGDHRCTRNILHKPLWRH